MKEIKLTKGQVALVDDEDYEWLNQWKWFAVKLRNTFYAMRVIYKKGGKGEYQSTICMHRLILGLTDSKIFVDHRDHNGLNNQRENLRAANRFENASNRLSVKNSTSKYLGVSWNYQNKNWRARICKNKTLKYLGSFATETDAAKAYNLAAIKLHGEFASLNKVY